MAFRHRLQLLSNFTIFYVGRKLVKMPVNIDIAELLIGLIDFFVAHSSNTTYPSQETYLSNILLLW